MSYPPMQGGQAANPQAQEWLMRLLQALMAGGGQGPRIDQSPGQGQQMPGAGLPGPSGGVRGGWGGTPSAGGLMGGGMMGGPVQPPDSPPPVGMGGPMMEKSGTGTLDTLGQSPYGNFNRQLPRRQY